MIFVYSPFFQILSYVQYIISSDITIFRAEDMCQTKVYPYV